MPYRHRYHVDMFEGETARDPIQRLLRRTDLAKSERVDPLAGSRGNGKRTQLRRLKALLGDRGCRVFLSKVGNTPQGLGRWSEAVAAFLEALLIAKRLAEALPDLPDYTSLPAYFPNRLARPAEGRGQPKLRRLHARPNHCTAIYAVH